MGQIMSAQCSSDVRLDKKTALVTGANTGIGKITAKDFYERGARVLLACRDLQKAEDAVADIKNQCKNKENLGELKVVELDLSKLKSVRACAEYILKTEDKINLLINNAGLMMCPKQKTEDGFELQFGTNHLGHFLLTLLLMPKLIDSRPVRIVNVSSLAHTFPRTIDFTDLHWDKRKYSPLGAYSQSKLANVLFTKELARRLKEAKIEGINVYSLHPGVIKTELSRHITKSLPIPGSKWIWDKVGPYIVKSPTQGAQTQIYCAIDEKCANETGLYYSECKVTEPSNAAKQEDLARTLWIESLKLVGLGEDYNPFEIKK